MRLLSRAVPVLLGLMFAACATIDVNTNYDPNAVQQLNSYRSYAWLPTKEGKDPRVYNDIIDGHLRRAVDQQLQGRGYRLVDPSASPDFLIGWQGAIDSKVSAETVGAYYGYYGYGWGPYWDPFYGPTGATYLREYEMGTLILDVVDAKAKKLVWRGTAQAELQENPSASSTQERIGDAVEEMLSRFPPKAAK
ncbi:DUF4136 domain-containing protein [Myxococcus sp. RHSTA-1-4]|uniref:DUF4136 domain-containing protein n=1 Tax=Myxococcus sp. RHSTA-1-4 TaxID=2874601 RepID=UPI001CBFD04A|nr:DUF4136 domain-containing protein [Myxococcus sp. RHSTA-1-4]MBZ4420202.1 DUF4136 domain-containing protein [Myxococcus sp. RHSTA-1-4]